MHTTSYSVVHSDEYLDTDPAPGQRTSTALEFEDTPADRGLAGSSSSRHDPHPAMAQKPGLGGQGETPLPFVQVRKQDLEPPGQQSSSLVG